MKLFIKRFLLFVIVILPICVALDFLISNGLKSSDYYAQGETFIWNEIVEGRISEDIYIYGSSRAWVHFDPEIIKDSLSMSAYNFGIDGHNFWFQHLRHKLLIENNPKPKLIVLSVDMFGFTKYKGFYNSRQFLPFIYNKDIRKYTSEYPGFNCLDYYLPLFRYYGRTKDIGEAFRSKDNTYKDSVFRRKGYRAEHRTWTADFNKAKSKMAYYEVNTYEPYKDLMHQFLEECKKLDIKVVMVYAPEYIEGQEFVRNRSELISTYESIAEIHQITFLDYSNDELCYNKSLFYNSQHLNAKGSRLFSEEFASNLKKMKLFETN
ncbi:hypothetical protein [Gaetbulibacter jejuensis]|uniref:DUF1574 domain-containing protein n=1 Tax=Gaetbulibacter jejuensis TaxID=584607 RepID=A0ABN1JX14_9FLAO